MFVIENVLFFICGVSTKNTCEFLDSETMKKLTELNTSSKKTTLFTDWGSRVIFRIKDSL